MDPESNALPSRTLLTNKGAPPSLPLLGHEQVGTTIEGRPVIKNPDGSFSTERTSTIQVDGKWINIPTMFGGKEVSVREASEIIRKNKFVDPETGRRLKFFDTVRDAEKAARERSKTLLEFF